MPSKAFTLVEILIGLVLMGVIILAVASVDITSRRFFGTASDESRIQDEVKIAMEHISKNIQLGIGDVTSPGILYGLTDCTTPYGEDMLSIRQPSNPPTLDNYNDDIWIGYAVDSRAEPTDHRGEFFKCSDAGVDHRQGGVEYPPEHEIIARGIKDFTVTIVDNIATISITARKDPNKDPGPNNPETTLTSSVVLRAMSIK